MELIFGKESRVDKLQEMIGTILLRVFCVPVYCLITETLKKNSLTHSWSRALLEKLPIVQPLKNFPACYGTRRFITVSLKETRIMNSLIGLFWCENMSLALWEEHTVWTLDLRFSQRWL
jgi:hypothetical protein